MRSDQKGLCYFAELLSEPPYASVFNKRDAQDKALMETNVVQEWAASLRKVQSRSVTNIRTGDDPPDFIASVDQRESSIELTELVDGNIKSEVARRRASGDMVGLGSGDIFYRSQWTKPRFFAALNKLIQKKEIKYRTRGISNIDYLLIHTAEPWLLPNDVNDWLAKTTISATESFKEVHLLMDYCPHRKYWPLFLLSQ